ncbi:MAG: hypothetical protein GFH27_549283n350 [Chloroflexi bacterium AL-W]|nr:hypothetical protein [Chloroflexi bacterium AL-N1]NOK64528.1 hypothetical protein [Chloroflexi bacterium AL-N10]NOK75770.1 hypothetical protein [Chloroflexi bacterium AL-N5]NOK80471.1 hypothetical protein [Chloroflexi bacterium AL-W]NOK86985.1 hypothetical protein [Chloroflexi bacterium AL-N15]
MQKNNNLIPYFAASHFQFLILAAACAVLLSLLIPTTQYADSSAPQGQLLVEHASGFAPLYALLSTQGTQGLTYMVIASFVYLLLALFYWHFLHSINQTGALTEALWHSRIHWGLLLCVWFGLLFAYPLLSDDAIAYLVHGRLAWIYQVNPYLSESRELLTNDSWHILLGPLQSLSSAYGPLWFYLSIPPVTMAGSSLPIALIVLKGVNLLLLITCGVIIYHLLSERSIPQRRGAVLALFWNPLVWLEVIWTGHNDIAMLVWILLALLAFQRNRYVFAVCLLMAAVATKYVPLIIVSLVCAAIVRQQRLSSQDIWWTVIKSICGSILVMAIAFLPIMWGNGTTIFAGLIGHATKINPSIGALVQEYGPAFVGHTIAQLIMPMLLIVLVLWQTWRVWHGAALPEAMLIVLLGYVFVISSWLMPWYGVWLIVLAVVVQSWLHHAVLSVTLILPAYYLINVIALPAWFRVLILAIIPLILIAVYRTKPLIKQPLQASGPTPIQE